MPKKGILDLAFPAAGYDKRFAYQHQPPYTSPDCLNVLPFDTVEGRERGGSRPCLNKAYYDVLGSGNQINLLNSVAVVQNNGLSFWTDPFNGNALGAAWAVANWGGMTLPTVLSYDYSQVAYNATVGAVRTALTFDPTQAYQIDLYVVPYLGVHNGTYSIFADMNNTTPVGTTDGIVAALTITGATGVFTGTLTSYNSGTPTAYAFSGGTDGTAEPGWFSVLISGTTITCYWKGASQVSQAVTLGGSAGQRMGFGMNCTVAGGICLADQFRVQYNRTDRAQVTRRILVASANGNVYKEGYYGDFNAATSSNLNLASDRLLQSTERAQSLYIADNGNPGATGTDGVITAGVMDAASQADWTALGISTYNDVVVVTAGTGSVTNDTYAITSIHATNGLTLTGAGAMSGNCTYRVERSPKVYDPVADTLVRLAATAGQVPTGCPLSCLYRDRLVLAGAPVAPHVWYMSRQGTLTDYDYTVASTDAQRAVAGTTADAGRVGEPITALMPHSDDYLMFGAMSSLWIMRGDPAVGGTIDCLSRTIGVVDKKAWCNGPNGEVIFLSRDGLYMLPPGGAGYPQSVSRERLPREMRDIDSTLYTTQLEWDPKLRVVHIYMTPAQGRGILHYMLSWETKGFFPVRLASNNFDPTATHYFTASNADDSAVLLGGRDGYVRRYRNEATTDDGTAISSYVMYGPIKLGMSDFHDGLLSELVGAASTNSGDITWNVYVASTAEQAVTAASFMSDTWTTAGFNLPVHVRARGHSACVKLTGAQSQPWMIERMTISRESAGRQKL